MSNKKKERKPSAPDIVSLGAGLEVRYISLHETLPQEHPVNQELGSLLKELFPNQSYRIHILDDETLVDAFSLPNGTIFVSRGLLKFVESTDELRLILAHEGIHIKRMHTRKTEDLREELCDHSEVKQRLSHLGMKRFHEYEADVLGLFETAGRPMHLAGVRRLFLRFDELEKQEGGSDLVHGTAIERIVNVGVVARLKDLGSHGTDEEPLSQTILGYQTSRAPTPKIERLAEELLEQGPDLKRYPLPGLGHLLHALHTHPAYVEVQALDQHNDPKSLLERFPETFPELIKRLRQELKRSYGKHAPAYERWFWQGLVGLSFDTLVEHPQFRPLTNPSTTDNIDWSRLIKKLNEDPGWQSDKSEFLTDVYREQVIQKIEADEFQTPHGFDSARLGSELEGMQEVLCLGVLDEEQREQFSLESQAILFQQVLFNLKPTTPTFFAELEQLTQTCMQRVTNEQKEVLALHLYLILTDTYQKKVASEQLTAIADTLLKQAPLLKTLIEVAREELSSSQPDEPRTTPEDGSLDTTESESRKRNLQRLKEHLGKNKLALDSDDAILSILERTQPLTEALKEKRFSESLSTAGQDMLEFLPNLTGAILDECREYVCAAYERDDWEQFFCRARGMSDEVAFEAIDKLLEGQTGEFSMDIHRSREVLDRLRNLCRIIEGTHPNLSEKGGKNLPLTNASDAQGHYLVTLALTEIFVESLVPAIENGLTKEEAFAQLRWFVEFTLRYYGSAITDTDEQNKVREGRTVEGFSSMFCLKLLQTYPFDLTEQQDAENLLTLSHCLLDPLFRTEWQQQLLQSILPNLPSGSERFRYCLEQPTARHASNMHALDSIVENEIHTLPELKEARSQLETHLESALEAHTIGTLSLIDALRYGSKHHALFSLMEFREDDSATKEAVLRWLHLKDSHIHSTSISELPPDIIIQLMLETERHLDQLAALDDWARYFILRHLLIGKDGLLLTVTKRRQTLLSLIDRAASPENDEEKEWHARIREVVRTIAEEVEPDQLFLAIAPLMQQQLLGPSQTRHAWEKTLTALHITDGKQRSLKMQLHQQRTQNESSSLAELSSTHGLHRLVKEGFFPFPLTPPEKSERWSVERFLIEVARNLGTPGTRFLQIMGQYLNVPPRLEVAMRDIYDQVPGQSKLTAAETVSREWSGAEKALQDFGARIGGGSLFSVYRTQTPEGPEVMKVLAPNAQAQNAIAFSLLSRLADSLQKKDPTAYALMPPLLQDLKQWIEGDLHDPEFLALDVAFREAHDGFQPAGHQYRITVPKTFSINGNDSPFIKRETFVHGAAWHRWEGSQAERKDVVALLVKSVFTQFNMRQVHSDIHPGNILITKEREVALIDRHHYLKLSEAEARALEGLLALASGSSAGAFIRSLDQTIAQDAPLIQRIDQELEPLMHAGAPAATIVGAVLQRIKRHDLVIPINVTLMIKNLVSLSRMGELAGFRDLQEALLFTPEAT